MKDIKKSSDLGPSLLSLPEGAECTNATRLLDNLLITGPRKGLVLGLRMLSKQSPKKGRDKEAPLGRQYPILSDKSNPPHRRGRI